MSWNRKIAFFALLVLFVFAIPPGRASGPTDGEDPSGVFPGVTDITVDNVDSIMDGSKHVLIEFYAPWCGWCKKMAADYRALGEFITSKTSDIYIAKVDATKNRDIATSYNVNGFPTILLVTAKDKRQVSYNGDRSVVDFVKFLNANTGVSVGDYVKPAPKQAEEKKAAPAPAASGVVPVETPSAVVVLTADNFDEVVQQNKNVFVKFFAPWCGHCNRMAPAYEELAKQFKEDDEVVIAELDGAAHKSVAQKYGVKGFPTIKMFSKADKSGSAQFKDARTLEKLAAFVTSFKTPSHSDEL